MQLFFFLKNIQLLNFCSVIYLRGRALLPMTRFQKCLQQARAGDQAGPSQSQEPRELHLDLPCGWKGPKYLSHHLLTNWVHHGRKLDLEAELELKLRQCGLG